MNPKESIRRLFNNDKAVSPVIGVILMVAITVILAAVIATFVLGLGDSLSNTGPTTSMSVSDAQGSSAPVATDEDANDLIVIQHDGGDTLAAGEYDIRLRHENGSSFTTVTNGGVELPEVGGDGNVTVDYSTTPSDISTGDDVVITVAASTSDYDYGGDKWDVQVIHTASDAMVMDQQVTTN